MPLLILAVAGLASCAAKEKPSAISTASTRGDSSLPWNQQEKWENEGQMGPMAERYEQGGNHR